MLFFRTRTTAHTPEKVRRETKSDMSVGRKIDILLGQNGRPCRESSLEAGSLEPCCICLEHGPDFVLRCGHSFHRECLQEWLTVRSQKLRGTSCPLCRNKFEVPNLPEFAEKPRTSPELRRLTMPITISSTPSIYYYR